MKKMLLQIYKITYTVLNFTLCHCHAYFYKVQEDMVFSVFEMLLQSFLAVTKLGYLEHKKLYNNCKFCNY